jgi:hypothetical protein
MNVPNRKQLKACRAKGQAANDTDISQSGSFSTSFARSIEDVQRHFPVQPAIARAGRFV